MLLQKWIIDPGHTKISFSVMHLMDASVIGYFREFQLTLDTEDDDFNLAKNIIFSAELDSIDTGNAQRDAHLRSVDFFNTEINRNLEFIGVKYDETGKEIKLIGDLRIGNITKSITVNVEFRGMKVENDGKKTANFNVTSKISRKDFGLSWSAITEAGNIVVGDEVKINAEIQLIKQTEIKTVD